MFDFGYTVSIYVLLQCAYLWYLNNISDNYAYFAEICLQIISLPVNTWGKENLKLVLSEEI